MFGFRKRRSQVAPGALLLGQVVLPGTAGTVDWMRRVGMDSSADAVESLPRFVWDYIDGGPETPEMTAWLARPYARR